MRLIICLLFTNLLSFMAMATGNVTAVASGDWSSKTTWNCNCVPASNLNVVIPEGISVKISKPVVLVAPAKIKILISGTLDMTGNSLYLDSDDQLVIKAMGIVQSAGAGGAFYFGKLPIFVSEGKSIDTVGTISAGKLPPKLIGFKARPEGNEVCIQWSSVQGFDFDVYTLDRSSDGVHFVTINQQCGINSTPDNFVNCIYYDSQPLEGMRYYRLKASRKGQEDAFVMIVLMPKETKRTTY